jgi:hypothetical protein
MSTITITTVDGLSRQDKVAIVHRLTRPGSEFQQEVGRCLREVESSSTHIAVWHDRGTLWAWARSHVWRDMQTLEMFTDPRRRGTGKAFALSAALASVGAIDCTKPLAVFSPTTESIARRLGFAQVQRFEHDWLPVK